jgi:hypothetical protein
MVEGVARKAFGIGGLVSLSLVLIACSPSQVTQPENRGSLEAPAPSPNRGLYIPNMDVSIEHWGEYLDYHAPMSREALGLAEAVESLPNALERMLKDIGGDNTAAVLESTFIDPIGALQMQAEEYPFARYETIVYYQDFFSGCLERLDSTYRSALLLGFEGGSVRNDAYEANKADFDLCMRKLSDLRASIQYTLDWDAKN